jgi:hypothetical protein
MSSNHPMLLFFSSGIRPRYARDVLDAMCYPTGHVIHFRYRKSLIEEDTRLDDNVLSLAMSQPYGDVEGLIVYSDGLELTEGTQPDDPLQDFIFYPIRYVEVLKPIEHGDWYYIPLKLGLFPLYKDATGWNQAKFNTHIHSINHHPRRYGHPTGEGYFVYRADESIRKGLKKCEEEFLQDAWEAKVKELRDTKRFKENTLFYRVDNLIEAKSVLPRSDKNGTTYTLKSIKSSYSSSLDQCIYNVEADVDFRIRVITYQGGKPLDNSPKIKLNADSNIFTGELNPQLLMDSAYNEESLFLRSKRATESSLASVELESIDGPAGLLAARPRFLIKVSPSFWQFIMLVALVLGCGQLLLAVNKEFLEPLRIYTPMLVPIAKLLGFMVTFGGVALAFRKLKVA